MPDSETLSHTPWDGKYQGVWTPQYRRQALDQELRQYRGEMFHALSRL